LVDNSQQEPKRSEIKDEGSLTRSALEKSMKLLITALVSSAATAAILLKDKIFGTGQKKRTKVVS
jgi:hypothetical protein